MVLFVCLAASMGCSSPTYDTVIANGRVMDPETGFDRVAHVGINQGVIANISDRPLRGTKTIDATGLVVAPGIIDIHSHGDDDLNYGFRALDGVTSMLDAEKGALDVGQWYAQREGKTLVNFGIAAGHGPARVAVMHDEYHGFHFFGPARTKAASPAEIDQMVALVRKGLADGAIGVGVTPFYTPAATTEEITRMFQAAAEAPGAAVYVHLRYTGLGTATTPSSAVALKEVLDIAETTNTPLQVCHVSTSGLSATPQLLAMIDDARRRGRDVTTEFYPYTAAMSGIKSTWFAPGWQEMLGISYAQLQWPPTGEYLTEKTFREYERRYPNREVVIHAIPEAALEAAVKSPYTMVVSDGLVFPDLTGHPRGVGTSGRVLAGLVRQQHWLTLMEALRKMSLMPAQRLEARVPGMKKKGRVQVGADADLTIFDPERVSDKSTFDHPSEHSVGFEYVLVAGVPVVWKGELQHGVAPGRAIRGPVASAATQTKAAAAAAQASARNEADAKRETERLAALWSYYSVPVDKGRQLSTALYSANDVETDARGGRRVQLVFRDHPSWGRSSYLVLQGGDFNCDSGCTVNVAVDGKAPKKMAARRTKTDEAIAMFINDWRTLWRLTDGASRLSIEFPVKAGGTRTAIYDVAGLDRSKMPGWDAVK
jgi:dihydroorotase